MYVVANVIRHTESNRCDQWAVIGWVTSIININKCYLASDMVTQGCSANCNILMVIFSQITFEAYSYNQMSVDALQVGAKSMKL